MKKIKSIFLTSLLATLLVTTTVGAEHSRNNVVSKADDLDYIWDDVIDCDDWYYSGKGFQFEFTYKKGTAENVEDHIQFTLKNSLGYRITNNYPGKITVDENGNVTSQLGNIIKNENGTYTFSMMFNEFVPSSWNTNPEEHITDGHERVTQIYFRWGSLQLTKIRSSLIDSKMNVVPQAEIRNEQSDSINGLMFKSYIPSVVTNAKYGMAIVPNEYLGKMTDRYCEQFRTSGLNFTESYCNPHKITSSDGDLYTRYGGGYYIKCSLAVKENNYLRDFSAVPFEEINGVRTYAWNTNEEKDSLYNVCSRARKENISYGTKGDTYVNSILNNVAQREAHLSTTNVTTYIVDNTLQILKNQSLSSGDTTLSFKAAKGETETGQMILKSTANNLTYFAGVSDLTNGSNIITHDNIEIDIQNYTNIISNWSATADHVSWLSDLYPTGSETCTLGYWPDALIPMHVAVRDGRNIIKTNYGANQGLFFRVNVPADAVSGTYTGKVIVYVVGQGLITVPVSLTVNNFSIAGRRDVNTITILNKTSIQDLYGVGYNNVCNSPYYSSAYNLLAERGISGGLLPKSWVNGNFEEYIQVVKNYVQNSPKTATYLMEFNQEHVTMKWTFKKSSFYNISSGRRTVDVDEDVFILEDCGTKKGLKTFFRALFDASTNDCDLLKGAVLYDPHADEPSSPSAYIRNVLNFNVMKRAIDDVLNDVSSVTGKDEVKNSLRNVFYLMTAGPEQSIAGSQNGYAFCDVYSISNVTVSNDANCCCKTLSDIQYRRVTDYCPNMMWDWQSGIDWESHSHKDSSKNPKASCGYCYDGLTGIYNGTETTKRMWEYTCVQPVAPFPSYTLNTPMIRIRANRWRQNMLNMQGFFYYMANRSENHPDEGAEIPMTEEQILNGEIYYGGASSDGLLMYPAYNTFNYADRNLYWLSSLRLENTAESNDDVIYLNYAKELIAEHGNQSSDINTLNSIYNSLYSDTLTYHRPSSVTTNSSTFKTARNNLIALIENLLSR